MRSQWELEGYERGLWMPLGERVKQLRKERRWSQDELAVKIGSDARQISRYENGRIKPSTDAIVKLAETFDVSIDYLLLDGTARRSLRPVDNGRLAERLKDIDDLTDEERASLLLILDAFLTKNKVKSLVAEAG